MIISHKLSTLKDCDRIIREVADGKIKNKNYVNNKSILITGGTGSFGKKFLGDF